MSERTVLQPADWLPPRGYANGIVAPGESIWLSGQIGWSAAGVLAAGLAAQVEQALRNIVALLAEAQSGPEDLVRLTWYLVSIDDYQANLSEIGRAYKSVIGKCFPTMSVVQVVRLVERDALVEIEATAVRRAAPPG